jgi:uncharacterized protein YjbI with pentapeptide repeats
MFTSDHPAHDDPSILSICVVGSNSRVVFASPTAIDMSCFSGAGKNSVVDEQLDAAKKLGLGSLLALSLVMAPQASLAVSGGGLDHANMDITGQDFSNNGNAHKDKDFTQVIAKGTIFAKSNLQGCRFYKAFLVRACQISIACVSADSYEIRKLTAFDDVVGQCGFFGCRFDRSCLGRHEHGWSLARGCRCNRSLL